MSTSATDNALVSARQLEELGIMKRGAAFRLAKKGLLVHYRTGAARGGLRFRVQEVLDWMRVQPRPQLKSEQT